MAGDPEKGVAADELDLGGLKCPLPAMWTERALAERPPGSRLTVTADDPLARLDIAHLCTTGGHEILEVEALGGTAVRFVIRRGPDA
jgi:tRNA 2-thiouridine synthesizing protein A